ncbi:MAG: helix-turn-helix transcriptional regulator [Halobacteriovoraceae bacterium]|nr:helix-turn-helix transcriptional regulator [Halobacteriovoraceae bacterium]
MELKDYLKKYCVTKTGFAKRLGVTYDSVLNIINGKAYPSAKTAQKIVELTNGEVTFEDLFKRKEEK